MNEVYKDSKEEVIKGNIIKTITKLYYTYSFDSGINSGKYSLLSSEMQKEISILYSAFKKLNEIRNFHKRRISEEELKGISVNVESLCSQLKLHLPSTVKRLEAKVLSLK